MIAGAVYTSEFKYGFLLALTGIIMAFKTKMSQQPKSVLM